MVRKLTEYNKFVKDKILKGNTLTEAAESWRSYKKTKKGSRSKLICKSRKTIKPKRSRRSRKRSQTSRKRSVGSRSYYFQ